MALANDPRTTMVQLGQKSLNEKDIDQYNGWKADNYRIKFMVVVFVKCGPSLVGKLHVLKIPP
jgi:hypothetical protein